LQWKDLRKWGLLVIFHPEKVSKTFSFRPVLMAKSDSFFIRASCDIGNNNATEWNQTAIDLGAYVDALGKSVLRIHNIAISFTDDTGASPDLLADKDAAAQFQLSTQSQTALVLPTNKGIIATGMVNAEETSGADGIAGNVSESFDNLPQLWTNGYLVAVDTMYLSGQASTGFKEAITVSIVCECTVETMSQASAMALALSQQ